MAEHFADRLLDAVARKRSVVCVGIDPILDLMPAELTEECDGGRNLDATIDAVFDFVLAVLRVVEPHAPAVKFQSAYFEKLLWEGVEAYYSLVQEAREMGFLVIGDVKRGDIGSTAEAYAAAHLAEPQFSDTAELGLPDAITVNPLMGMDTLRPALDVCRDQGKGVFVLVRTSNPGSADLQDQSLADGRTFSELIADRLAPLASDPSMLGAGGFSSIGAVVGATQPHTMRSLRQRLHRSIFLLPGYGTQGATAEMTRDAFVEGRGALVSASRSVLYAHREARFAAHAEGDWLRCVERSVVEMKTALQQVIGG